MTPEERRAGWLPVEQRARGLGPFYAWLEEVAEEMGVTIDYTITEEKRYVNPGAADCGGNAGAA